MYGSFSKSKRGHKDPNVLFIKKSTSKIPCTWYLVPGYLGKFILRRGHKIRQKSVYILVRNSHGNLLGNLHSDVLRTESCSINRPRASLCCPRRHYSGLRAAVRRAVLGRSARLHVSSASSTGCKASLHRSALPKAPLPTRLL